MSANDSNKMKMHATNSGGVTGNMLKGLKKISPSVSDASRNIKGGSVDAGATRKDVSAQQATLGPRSA